MKKIPIGIALVLAMSATQSPAAGEDNPEAAGMYTRNLLFNPSESLLEAESRGRITIYDSIDDSEVEDALDTQFGRIENMMFVRIRRTLDNGGVDESDDCE